MDITLRILSAIRTSLRQLITPACISALLCLILNVSFAQLPPAPSPPELSEPLRAQTFKELTSPDYQTREAAEERLMNGDLDTARAIVEYVKRASPEGKVRAASVVEALMLRFLRTQADEKTAELQDLMLKMRLASPEMIGVAFDEFAMLHQTLIARACIRSLLRNNAVIKFEKSLQRIPGLGDGILSDYVQLIYLGSNFTGTKEDLWQISLLLQMSDTRFGTSRGIYHVGDCPIPIRRLEELAAGINGAFVVHRGPAHLGIAGPPTSRFGGSEDWKIINVQPATAAKYAGLQREDAIVRLDGELVGTFDSFTRDLEAYQPADVITLDVIRADTPKKTLTLELSEGQPLGINLDRDFKRFPLIKSVDENSAADEAGLDDMYRIYHVNGRPVFDIRDVEIEISRASGQKAMPLTVRKLEPVKVQLRGWVGEYR